MSEGMSPSEERICAAEVIAALSLATDLTMGFDFEHGLRSTLVAARLAERLSVDRETASHTYYACLLQQVGCTADAHVRAAVIGDFARFMEHFMPVWYGAPGEMVTATARSVAPDAPLPVRAIGIARRVPKAARVMPRVDVACREVARLLIDRLGLAASIGALFSHVDERWTARAPTGQRASRSRWEDLAEHPPFADKLLELVAREETGRAPSYGPALDLGCGSAVWGVRRAKRGWEVTGVDIVEKALRRARKRVDGSGVQMRLLQADVTALRQADLGSDFRLVLDTGTFHGLTDPQREAMGREVDAICAYDAAVLLDCFAPRRIGPLPRGASRADVERAFPGWEVVDVEIADTEPDALARLFKFEERFYRLRRADSRP